MFLRDTQYSVTACNVRGVRSMIFYFLLYSKPHTTASYYSSTQNAHGNTDKKTNKNTGYSGVMEISFNASKSDFHSYINNRNTFKPTWPFLQFDTGLNVIHHELKVTSLKSERLQHQPMSFIVLLCLLMTLLALCIGLIFPIRQFLNPKIKSCFLL